MNKYVVAYISFHDNELKQELVEAKNPLDAAISYLGWTKEEQVDYCINTIKELKNFLFDMDSTISVIDIVPKFRLNPSRPWSKLYDYSLDHSFTKTKN